MVPEDKEDSGDNGDGGSVFSDWKIIQYLFKKDLIRKNNNI